ncbi:MAG: histidine kinase [Chthonomonadales bacterium]
MPTRKSGPTRQAQNSDAAEALLNGGAGGLSALVQAALQESDAGRLFETGVESLLSTLGAEYVAVVELSSGTAPILRSEAFVSGEAPTELQRKALALAKRSRASRAPILTFPKASSDALLRPAAAVVPVATRAGLFGALVGIAPADKVFQGRDLAVAQLAAGILACGIQRIHTEHLAHNQWTALRRTAATLTGGPELRDFLKQILQIIGEELSAACVALWLHNPQHDALSVSQAYERTRQDRLQSPLRGAGTSFRAAEMPLWKKMVKSRSIVIIPGMDAEPQSHGRQWVLGCASKAMIMVPLTTSDEPIGCIAIGADTADYPPEELLWMQTLAQQAALAVHLAALAEQSRRAAILEERNRMAREIHDTLAQGFTGILMQLEALEDKAGELPAGCLAHLAQARELARASLAEARRSVWSLRLHVLEGYDLPGAFSRLIGQMTAGSQVAARFRVQGVPRPLPGDTEAHILRIGLEALTNAIKHAAASHIRIALTYRAGSVRLSVRDDGKGFVVPKVPSGFGLAGMRERAHCLGAKLTIRSKPGQGTAVTLVVPTSDSA